MPGPNGPTIGFYKKFFTKFGQLYVDVLNKSKRLSDTFNESIVRLIPKNSNEIKTTGDFRPISLTNYDYRIYAHVIKKQANENM